MSPIIRVSPSARPVKKEAQAHQKSGVRMNANISLNGSRLE